MGDEEFAPLFDSAVAFATAFRHADHESMIEIVKREDPLRLAAALAQMVWISTFAVALLTDVDEDAIWKRFALLTSVIYGTNGETTDGE